MRHIFALLQKMVAKLEYGSEQPNSELAERSGILQCCDDRSPALIYEDNAEKRDSGGTQELNVYFLKRL